MNTQRLSMKVWNDLFNRTYCSKWSASLCYFWFYQIEWRQSKVEVTLLMPAS